MKGPLAARAWRYQCFRCGDRPATHAATDAAGFRLLVCDETACSSQLFVQETLADWREHRGKTYPLTGDGSPWADRSYEAPHAREADGIGSDTLNQRTRTLPCVVCHQAPGSRHTDACPRVGFVPIR